MYKNYEMYKNANKDVKKKVSYAKAKAYKDLYNKLETREWDIFELVRMRERKSTDLDHGRCIKSEDQKVLVKNNDLKERWKKYFNKFSNEYSIGGLGTREDTWLVGHVKKSEILLVWLDLIRIRVVVIIIFAIS